VVSLFISPSLLTRPRRLHPVGRGWPSDSNYLEASAPAPGNRLLLWVAAVIRAYTFELNTPVNWLPMALSTAGSGLRRFLAQCRLFGSIATCFRVADLAPLA